MEGRIADWIDIVFEKVLKKNGILKNSDLEELSDGFENLYKTVEKDKELERDVAEGFEKLYKTVEKDKELELEGFSDEDDGGEEFEKEHFKKEEEINKLDKKNASDDMALNIIDSESERNIPNRNEKYEVADDEFVTLMVNNLPVTARKNITSKTTLCLYCQQNKLPQPQYTVTRGTQKRMSGGCSGHGSH